MTSLTRYAAMAAWLLVASALTGCEGGRERPPGVTARVLHAAPARGTLNFLREQRNETQLDYRQASGTLFWDSDDYDFSVQAVDANGTTTTLLGGFSRTLVPDQQYFFVITEAAGELRPIIVEKTPFTGTSAEIVAVHAAPSLGPMSIYVEPDGIVPSAVSPVGTLGFGEIIQPATRAPGDYRVSLTEAGNPTNVLMMSGIVSLGEGQSYTFTVLDPAEDSIAPVAVSVVGPESTLIFDDSTQSALTVINAAADGLARDVFVDDDFAAPVLAAVPALARSGPVDVVAGSRKLSVTPAGNAGAVEAEVTSTFARSRHHVALVGGDPGKLAVAFAVDERRRITDHARITFMNAATQFGTLEYFLVAPGTDVSTLSSSIVLNAPGMSTRFAFPPGDYELTVRELNGGVLAGPVPVTMAGSGVYSVLTTNGAVPGTVDFVYFEDFVD